jgi:hypothetical protein
LDCYGTNMYLRLYYTSLVNKLTKTGLNLKRTGRPDEAEREDAHDECIATISKCIERKHVLRATDCNTMLKYTDAH